MHKRISPPTIAKEFADYAHAIETTGNVRWLHISGQVGVDALGKLGDSFEAQTEIAFANIKAILREAGMSVSDIVKYTTYVTRPDDVVKLRDIRQRFQGDHRAASTLVVVQALARPEWLIEIEVVAAKA